MNVTSTFKVEIESPEGNAVLTFKKPKMNDLLDNALRIEKIENPLERIREHYREILRHVVDVQGIEADGEKVTAETIKDLGLDFQTMTGIVAAYNQATNPDKDEPEKKDLKSE